MARDNIFNKLSKKRDYRNEILRIDLLLNNKNGILIEEFSDNLDLFNLGDKKPVCIIDFVDAYAFKSWKHRNRCIDLDDMRNALNLPDCSDSDDTDIDAETFLNYCEYAANIVYLVDFAAITTRDKWSKTDVYTAARANIKECLAWLNYEAKIIEKQQRVLVVEKNAAATAVAEIVDDDLAYEIIHYNHFALKGDIDTKKSILLKFAGDLEPKRKELSGINNQLENDIFFLFNNVNLRHNNRDKKDKHYIEFVAKMRKNELEEWYDELYQMILLAYLEIDQVKRKARVKELKRLIDGGRNNG